MKLEIHSFADIGDISKERLVLRALDDINIGDYVILRSKRSNDGGPLSGAKSAYWLPDVVVKVGDLIILYTKTGAAGKKALSRDRTAHFYYWRMKEAIWGADKGNIAIVLESKSWESKSPVS
ncbi:hypothetical protein F6X37_26855 [Paraburkholderia sp. 31.1]|uniref:hypothetical protein n=1 Tax=Paraburkholderia sp. 31.1 TaxID=2615205 RepID=UPI00165658AB|nr:hypothetical protein [Paraburkholderia sp. 31.1]MBC8725069.1 hypothetical protein [Paraburkholderia sp. 31.1]